MSEKQNIIVVIGPTASGKTSRAIALAKERDGEVISADSRQIYRELDIGTEKVTRRKMQGIPHHCLDIASPRRACSVERWRRYAQRAIDDIVRRGKVPIVAGGSWFYVNALVYGTEFPKVEPNAHLRKRLERKTPKELYTLLASLDPVRAATIEHTNPRRLIRAIEIANTLGSVPPLRGREAQYIVEWILLDPPLAELEVRIAQRLDRTLRRGLVHEVEGLRKKGLSWKRIHELGLEYRAVGELLRGILPRSSLKERLLRDLLRYAKKQGAAFRAMVPREKSRGRNEAVPTQRRARAQVHETHSQRL